MPAVTLAFPLSRHFATSFFQTVKETRCHTKKKKKQKLHPGIWIRVQKIWRFVHPLGLPATLTCQEDHDASGKGMEERTAEQKGMDGRKRGNYLMVSDFAHLLLQGAHLAQGQLNVRETIAELFVQFFLHVLRLDVIHKRGLFARHKKKQRFT